MARPKRTFTESIKHAIADSGKTRYQIAQESGVEQSALSRFMSGERGLNTVSLDALADVLGLRIVVDKPRGKRGESR